MAYSVLAATVLCWWILCHQGLGALKQPKETTKTQSVLCVKTHRILQHTFIENSSLTAAIVGGSEMKGLKQCCLEIFHQVIPRKGDYSLQYCTGSYGLIWMSSPMPMLFLYTVMY